MPLVANSNLPSFERLRDQGQTVLDPDRARQQDIRELHVGLLNMMPDAALAATERQFFRLVGESNPIAQFHMHPFTVPELPRHSATQAYVAEYYETFERIRNDGLDALIITGANVTQPDLAAEPFWEPLIEVIDWAEQHVTSTLCSCLATHAVMQFRHRVRRRGLSSKCWGVFSHRVLDDRHPLVHDVNSPFDVPHSRFNEVSREQFETAGLHVLAESPEAGVQIAVSADGFRLVFFQGHPEYDTISLLKEYKREVTRFAQGQTKTFPPFPTHYFRPRDQAVLEEFQMRLRKALARDDTPPELPEALLAESLDNTWHDTGEAVVGNWIGQVYQITHRERRRPFMAGIDPLDPLGLGYSTEDRPADREDP